MNEKPKQIYQGKSLTNLNPANWFTTARWQIVEVKNIYINTGNIVAQIAGRTFYSTATKRAAACIFGYTTEDYYRLESSISYLLPKNFCNKEYQATQETYAIKEAGNTYPTIQECSAAAASINALSTQNDYYCYGYKFDANGNEVRLGCTKYLSNEITKINCVPNQCIVGSETIKQKLVDLKRISIPSQYLPDDEEYDIAVCLRLLGRLSDIPSDWTVPG